MLQYRFFQSENDRASYCFISPVVSREQGAPLVLDTVSQGYTMIRRYYAALRLKTIITGYY